MEVRASNWKEPQKYYQTQVTIDLPDNHFKGKVTKEMLQSETDKVTGYLKKTLKATSVLGIYYLGMKGMLVFTFIISAGESNDISKIPLDYPGMSINVFGEINPEEFNEEFDRFQNNIEKEIYTILK